jgi:hypothetical protein
MLAPRGLREREEGGLERVEDAAERRRLLMQALWVHVQAVVVAGALTAFLIFARSTLG